MYGYADDLQVTPQQLLQKVSQEEIFELILQQPFSYSLRYTSPFRLDKRPGCRFERRPDGEIVFIDFGERNLTGRTHRSCFGMVMDRYNFTVGGATRFLCEKYGLSTNSEDYQPVAQSTFFTTEKKPSKIFYDKKPYDKRDKQWWSNFLIKVNELEEDNVFSVKKFNIVNHKGNRSFTPYGICYAIDFVTKIKLYQPYKIDYRFITNCDEDNIGNIDNLPPTGEQLIIQKSYKDHRVLRNLHLGLNVIWLQNEGCIPSIDILTNLVSRFKSIIIFFDSDKGGIIAARSLLAILNHIRSGCASIRQLPRKQSHVNLYGKFLKDPAEYINKEGKGYLIDILHKINII